MTGITFPAHPCTVTAEAARSPAEQIGTGLYEMADGALHVVEAVVMAPLQGIRWLFGFGTAEPASMDGIEWVSAAEVDRLREDVARLKSGREHDEAKLETIKDDLDLSRGLEAEASTRADTAEAKIVMLEQEVVVLTEERDELKGLLAAAKEEIDVQDATINDLRVRLGKLTQAKGHVVKEVKRHAADARELRQELAKVVADLKVAQAEIAQFKKGTEKKR
jgi:hypothetical protein